MDTKKALSITLFLSLLCLSATQASATSEWIVWPSQPGALKPFLKANRKWIRATEPLFTAESTKAISLDRARLATQAVKIVVADGISHDRFQAKANAFKGILAQENQSVVATQVSSAPSPLEKYLWQFHSQPTDMQISTTDWMTLPFKKGEDLGIDLVAKETPIAEKILVAVIDSGIDFMHSALDPLNTYPEPDLPIHITPSECKALDEYTACKAAAKLDKTKLIACEDKYAKVDTDHNGYPMDCSGWNVVPTFKSSDVTQPPNNPAWPRNPDDIWARPNVRTGIQGDQNPNDNTYGHGTHVAGIIGALEKPYGVRGVSQNVEILPVKVILSEPNEPILAKFAKPGSDSPEGIEKRFSDDHLRTMTDMVARGINYAINSHAKVINISLAWPARMDAQADIVHEMIDDALSKGIIVVAAAGNDATDAKQYPCAYDGVICVTSHNPDGSLSHWSNFGAHVDLAAPGMSILSTYPVKLPRYNMNVGRGYEAYSGSSMAAPMVSGLAARLLGQGFSPTETVARILKGTRPVQRSPHRTADTAIGFLQSGNAQLASINPQTPGALQVKKSAWIIPATKKSVDLYWYPGKPLLPFEIALKNIWEFAKSVELKAAIVNSNTAAQYASLEQTTWNASGWNTQETKSFSTALKISNDRFDGRLAVEVIATVDGVSQPPMRISLNVKVPLLKELAQVAPKDFQFQPIDGTLIADPATDASAMRTLNTFEDREAREFLLIDRSAKTKWRLQRLVPRKSAWQAMPPVETEALAGTGDFISADLTYRQWIDLDHDGNRKLVLVFKQRHGKTGKYWLKFVVLSPELKFLRSFDFYEAGIQIPDTFGWMWLDGKGLVPAWAGPGTTPEVEKPPYDEWEPFNDPPMFRFYYISDGKVHTLAPPDGYLYARSLGQSDEQKKSGSIPVLLVTENERSMHFANAEVKNLKPTPLVPLTLTEFKNLARIPRQSAALELNSSVDALDTGTVFSGSGEQAKLTYLARGSNQIGNVYAPVALQELDQTMIITAYFNDSKNPANTFAYTQTHYDIELTQLSTGKRARTSLNNNTFLTENIIGKGYYPYTLISRDQSVSRLPVLWSPDGGASDLPLLSEVIVPVLTSNGELSDLSRPAKFRYERTRDCPQILLPKEAHGGTSLRAYFYCRSGILSTLLNY